jgi:two-component system OmpR family sensor kinase
VATHAEIRLQSGGGRLQVFFFQEPMRMRRRDIALRPCEHPPMNVKGARRHWSGPPLALQIMGLLLGGLVVAQGVTLALTMLLPPEPQRQWKLSEIARELSGQVPADRNARLLQRTLQAAPPEPKGQGWLTSERSRRDLAQLLERPESDLRLYFFTPLPFAGTAGAAGTTRLEPRAEPRRGLDTLRQTSAAFWTGNIHRVQAGGGPGGGGPGGGMGGMGGMGRGGMNAPGGGFGSGMGPPGAPPQRAPGAAAPGTNAPSPPPGAPPPSEQRTAPDAPGAPGAPSGPAGTSNATPPPPPAGAPPAGSAPPADPVPGGLFAPPSAGVLPRPPSAPFTAPARRPEPVVEEREGSSPPAISPPRKPPETPPAPQVARPAPAPPIAAAPPPPPAAAPSRPPPDPREASPAPDSAAAGGQRSAVRGFFGLAPAPFVEGDFIAAVYTPEGSWAVVQPVPEPFPNAWQRRVLLWFLIAAAIVAPLGWLFSRRLVRPIASFARAAEQLGRDPAAPVLALEGPAEIGRAAQAFNGMQARLRSFVDDRTVMIGAISHDLRTPLTRMRFRIEDVPDDMRTGMLQDVEEMEQMIGSVLSFIRDASVVGTRERMDFASLVEDVVEQAVFVGKDVRLERMVQAPVEVDAMGMRRVLDNLIENAAKYGTQARVRLFTNANEAVAEISDRGPGLSADELERVFQPFYRTAAARSSGAAGSGLGLAVCRSIARAHGGDVTLKCGSHGLVAQVRLPLVSIAG